MAPDKSLAAEIEAVLRKHIKCDATGLAPAVASVYLQGVSEAAAEVAARMACISRTERDRADTFRAEWRNAASRASSLEAEIAALQSRAFEDGARGMRERAAEIPPNADLWRDQWDGQPIGYAMRAAIHALPLQPEGERNV